MRLSAIRQTPCGLFVWDHFALLCDLTISLIKAVTPGAEFPELHFRRKPAISILPIEGVGRRVV